jgi:hypothetical protein
MVARAIACLQLQTLFLFVAAREIQGSADVPLGSGPCRRRPSHSLVEAPSSHGPAG